MKLVSIAVQFFIAVIVFPTPFTTQERTGVTFVLDPCTHRSSCIVHTQKWTRVVHSLCTKIKFLGEGRSQIPSVNATMSFIKLEV